LHLRHGAIDADILARQPGTRVRGGFARGWGTGGYHKRVTPAAAPPKYRHALERSGNPKDTDEIMVGMSEIGMPRLRLRRRIPV